MRELYENALRLHQSGQLQQAEALYRQILLKMPGQADTLNAFGMLCHQSGRLQEACALFERAAKAAREAPHVLLNLAETWRALGDVPKAVQCCEKALRLRANNPDAHFCLGSALHDAGELQRAVACYRKALQLRPAFAEASNSLGLALDALGERKEALAALRQAVQSAPNYAEAHLNLGNLLYRAKDREAAMQSYVRCLRLQPRLPQAHLGMARLMLDSLMVSDANDLQIEQHLQQAGATLAGEPGYLSALGTFRARQGRLDEAHALLREALESRPDPETLYQYAYGRKFTASDELLERCAQQLQDPAATSVPEERALVHFAQGKVLNDLQRPQEAFEQFRLGNQLMNAGMHYDLQKTEQLVDALSEIYSAEFIARNSNPDATQGSKLVFVVGMPRSGTTLTEQILSRHPAVLGAGELFGMVALEERLPALIGSQQAYPLAMQQFTGQHAEELAQAYVDDLERHYPGGHARLTDKFPLNFWRVGLLALLFPGCRIIHVKRDAMDCCLSNYFQKFADGHAFAYDLANLGHYYRQFERLMAHWRTVLPGRVFELQYEHLVADPEYWTHALVEHIGLEWDDACLNPHEHARSVRTSSHWQVRQPIYRSSVERWRPYESQLGPLRQALGLN